MPEPEQHQVYLETVHQSGAEQWHCPTCGRRVVLKFSPGAETLILERGDKYALTWGSSTGTVAAVKIVLETEDDHALHGAKSRETFTPVEETANMEDMSLWQELLETVDFGDWENEG
jgi:hypothetical protein